MGLLALLLLVQADVAGLIEQLNNRSCAFAAPVGGVCLRKPLTERLAAELFGWLLLRHSEYECRLAAARCLEKMGPQAAEAVPALIQALRDGPDDFDTGDGIIPVRSAAAAALAATRDPRAIDALGEALRERPGRSESALVDGLGAFGPAAGRQWAAIAAVLRRRNSDTDFRLNARERFQRRVAAHPIEPGSAKYLREFEAATADHAAHAAAQALGRLRHPAAQEVLAETLANPHAAAAAAKALAAIGQPSEPVLAALERGLLDARLGPIARAECARALGALGAARAVGLLRIALQREETALAAAESLGQLGKASWTAVPDLLKIVSLPSLAVANERGGLHWSLEAGHRADLKRAAVRALFAIEPGAAAAKLARYRDDPDAGWVISRERVSKPAAR